jgi:GNAT superfamily N-acetyltransferase
MSGVLVRPYRDADAGAFRALNLQWIAHYFEVEAKDLEAVDHPERILAEGGAIVMAELDGAPVGTCALLKRDADTWELAKMAVAPARRGAGIGAALMAGALETGRALGAKRLYLESNARLTPAITLYEKSGFRHLAPEERPDTPYKRCDVFMELILD